MYHRIQKLLVLGEYRGTGKDSTILIESPFAQVDAAGRGIRAVQLGLSAGGALYVAVDEFVVNRRNDLGQLSVSCRRDDPPEVDCLELLAVLPLEFCKLRMLCHVADGREVLRVTLVTGRRLYFEFGGAGPLRVLLINVWYDRIQELNRKSFCQATTQPPEVVQVQRKEYANLPKHLRDFLECSESSSINADPGT